MRYYTEQINKELAYILKEKGMPLELTTECLDSICVEEPTNYEWLDKEIGNKTEYKVTKYYALPNYAEVFDWLLTNKYNITIHQAGEIWFPSINDNSFAIHFGGTWFECADEAIKYVLEKLNVE